MNVCTFPGCLRRAHARDLCGAHYQQWRKGTLSHGLANGPKPVDSPDWQPPSGLSDQWHASMRARGSRRLQGSTGGRERPCGLDACGGVAQSGSDLCPAHHHWREAQKRLAAKGLA